MYSLFYIEINKCYIFSFNLISFPFVLGSTGIYIFISSKVYVHVYLSVYPPFPTGAGVLSSSFFSSPFSSVFSSTFFIGVIVSSFFAFSTGFYSYFYSYSYYFYFLYCSFYSFIFFSYSSDFTLLLNSTNY